MRSFSFALSRVVSFLRAANSDSAVQPLRAMERMWQCAHALALVPALAHSQVPATHSRMSSRGAAQSALTASASSNSSAQPALTLGAPSAGASSSGGGARPDPGNAEQLAVKSGCLQDARLGPIHLKQDRASVLVWKLIQLRWLLRKVMKI